MDDKPKLYSKGTLDQVELNKYVDAIRNGYNEFERSLIGKYYINQNGDKVKIKEKHIPMIRNAYSDMLRRVASGDDTFLAKIEGGFLDKTGKISNIDSFDNYGIVASYFGNVLRNMDSYTEPTVAKAKYTKDTLGKEFTKRLLGNSSSEYFINTDELDDNGVRSTKNRTESTKNVLQSLLDDLKNNKLDYEGYTDEQRMTDISNIENLFSVFNDNEIKENEYFQLGKILGLNNLSKLYSTSEKPTDNLETLNINDFYKYVLTKYSVPSSYTMRNFDLSTESIGDFSQVKEELDQMDNNQLYESLNEYLNGEIDDSSKIVITEILTRLNNNGEFKSYGEGGPNIYYIPKLNTNYNTGFVWDSNRKTLTEKPLYDIDPYFLYYIYPQYGQNYPDIDLNIIYSVNRQLPRRKNGGILYADSGTKFLYVSLKDPIKYNSILDALTYTNEDLTNDRRIQSVYDKDKNIFSYINRTTSATDNINTGNNQYDPELGGAELELLEFYKNWLNILTSNPKVAEAYARRYKDLYMPNSDFHYKSWFNDDGSFNFENFKNSTVYNDGINGIGHDFYRGRVYQMLDENGNPLEGYYNTIPEGYELVLDKPELDSNNLAWIYKILKKKPDIIGSTIEKPNPDEINLAISDITETDTYNGNNTNFQSIFDKYSPDILNTARLWLSINANNRITDTIRPAYDPTFLNTYERFSPITGNWYLRSKYYQDAANLQSKFSTPTTSDASLYTNTMLDASNIASRTRLAGDVADNAEIKKTADEALKRVEDNMKRRSDIANTNRDRMAKSDLLKAELEAMRINKNWKSIDNWVSGMEDRMRAKLLETKDFAKTVATDSAKRQYDEMISPAKEALMNWEGQKEGNTLANWDLKNKYLRFMEAAATRYPSLQLSALSGVLGTYYDNPYKEPLNWYTFNKNGGVLNRKNDFITQIIKLNNERNS